MIYDETNPNIGEYQVVEFYDSMDRMVESATITYNTNSTKFNKFISEYLTVPSILFEGRKPSESEEDFQSRYSSYLRFNEFFGIDENQLNSAELISFEGYGLSLIICCDRKIQKVIFKNDSDEIYCSIEFTNNEVLSPKVFLINRLENQTNVQLTLHKNRVSAHQDSFCGTKGAVSRNTILTTSLIHNASFNTVLDSQGVFAITNDNQHYFLGSSCLHTVGSLSNRRDQFPYSHTSLVGDSNITIGE